MLPRDVVAMSHRISPFLMLVGLLLSGNSSAVEGSDPPRRVSFELDIQPILTARGCNQGACHGKARGQNGFQLSLLGFDADFDFDALTKNAKGRRVFPGDPARSLLLLKGTGFVPHGGGVRLEAHGEDYEVIERWIAQGHPRRVDNEPTLTRIAVEPAVRFLKPREEQALKVTAFYSDGSSRDVTNRTLYQSSEAVIAAVDKAGLIKAGPLPGEATIMTRYMHEIAGSQIAIPLPGEVSAEYYAKLPRGNFIDDLCWKKLQTLGITVSETCDDAKFLRRVHLDIIGRLPTTAEARVFLADSSADKRTKLVDSLLQRPEYADHWAAKWADLLRPNPYRVGVKAVLNYDQWIRDSFRKNKPYDQFVRELVSAKGSTFENGAAVLFRDRPDPPEVATLVSQLFLGIRLECAKCHHHPNEKYGQDDFYQFAAFFERLGHKGTGLSPPISGGEEFIVTGKKTPVLHPVTKVALGPKPLFGDMPAIGENDDPRDALANWIASPENPFFRQVIVNRMWADFLGRGIVEPVDDLRATNPSTHPLLVPLADHFRDQKFDLKQLIRTICASQVYQRSSLPTDRNAGDSQNFSRHYRRRLRGEILLDAVNDITGIREKFTGLPEKSRANELWTTRIQSTFLDTFGRPNPNQDPPCERMSDPTATQTLHLMNSPQLHDKVTSDASRMAKLAASPLASEEVVEEVYLLVYSRFPDAEERQIGRELLAEGKNRRHGIEDLVWALLNTPEFVFQD